MARLIRTGLVLLGAAFALSMPAFAMAQEADSPELDLSALEPEAGSDTITIPSVTLAEPGYVAIHEGSESEFGAVIGSSDLLDAGTHEDVEITLDRELEGGEYVWAMLHTEATDNEEFDSAQDDPPVTDEQAGNAAFGGVVTFPVQVGGDDAGAGAQATPTATPGTDGQAQTTPTPTGTPGPASAGNAGLAGEGGTPLLLVALLLALTTGGVVAARKAATR